MYRLEENKQRFTNGLIRKINERINKRNFMMVGLHIKENNNLLPKLGYRTVLGKDSK